jgi:hypothetical protein
MNSVQNAQLDPSAEQTDGEGQRRCAVCKHDLRGHDPISRRYCQATQAQALPRGCICTPSN